jgi:vancomycin resistance protein YoaR
MARSARVLARLMLAAAVALLAGFVDEHVAAGAPSSDGVKPSKGAKKKKVDTSKLDVLARFSTKFKCCEPRTKNIARIAKLMDGVVVEPGRAFSVNQHVGARTADKGFVSAPSILDLEYTETIGGGVSQFATTLYNALYDAGFPIIEHKPHSHYIPRYPDGVEATLSWPGPDLVFKNDSEHPLVIKTTVASDRVTVKLYGKTPGRTVERRRPVELERKPPPTELVADRSVSPKKQKVERAGSPRKSVQVTRVITQPGLRRVEEDVVVYLASKRVVRVHPCRLPKGHKEYTGEACNPRKKKKSNNATEGSKDAPKAKD